MFDSVVRRQSAMVSWTERGLCVRILDVDVACSSSRTGVPDRFTYGVITKISTNELLAFAS